MKEENRSDEVTYVLNESDTAHFTTPAKLFEMSNCIDAEEFSDSDVGQGLKLLFLCNAFPRIPAGVLALVVAGEIEPEVGGDSVRIRLVRETK